MTEDVPFAVDFRGTGVRSSTFHARLTSIDYSDTTPDVTFTHDSVGNRLTMTDGSGTETRTTTTSTGS